MNKEMLFCLFRKDLKYFSINECFVISNVRYYNGYHNNSLTEENKKNQGHLYNIEKGLDDFETFMSLDSQMECILSLAERGVLLIEKMNESYLLLRIGSRYWEIRGDRSIKGSKDE